jgi:hypothetical protein
MDGAENLGLEQKSPALENFARVLPERRGVQLRPSLFDPPLQEVGFTAGC